MTTQSKFWMSLTVKLAAIAVLSAFQVYLMVHYREWDILWILTTWSFLYTLLNVIFVKDRIMFWSRVVGSAFCLGLFYLLVIIFL